MSYAGTQGWYTCQPLSKRRMGVPGPDPDDPSKDAPFVVSYKLRTAGRHEGYRSLWEKEHDTGYMLLVLDERRSIVGQVFGTTQAACHRKMNSVFEAKGLGIYNSEYAD
jgi:hypothetical protein